MTGGVEISLPRECSIDELADLANMWIPEFSTMPGKPHEKRTSNAYRILELVKESPAVSSETKAAIETLLS
jgi:hypothetical protein